MSCSEINNLIEKYSIVDTCLILLTNYNNGGFDNELFEYLDPIESIFLHQILSKIRSDSVSSDLFPLLIESATESIVKEGDWDFIVKLYFSCGMNEKGLEILNQYCSTDKSLNENEARLVSIFQIPRSVVFESKINQLIKLLKKGNDEKYQIQMLQTAMELSFSINNFERLNFILFDLYLPLIWEIGKDPIFIIKYMMLLQENEVHNQNIEMFLMLKTLSDGEILDDSKITAFVQNLKSRWRSYSLRRFFHQLSSNKKEHASF